MSRMRPVRVERLVTYLTLISVSWGLLEKIAYRLSTKKKRDITFGFTTGEPTKLGAKRASK